MEKSFRQLLREYFQFSKKDRRGVLLLGSLILLVLAGIIVADNFQLKEEYDFTEFKKALQEWEQEGKTETRQNSLFSFNPNTISKQQIDSLQLPPFVKNNIMSYRNAGGKFDNPEDVRKIYGMNDSIYEAIEKYIVIPEKKHSAEPERETKNKIANSASPAFSGTFDPNSADSLLLSEFGFNSFQTSNLLKYRKSGSAFSSPVDLLKIYGIDSIFFVRIKNHIQIQTTDQELNEFSDGRMNEPAIHIELNAADSLDLIKLPGIGSVFASRIIKYRLLLGGYNSVEQLLDVYNFPEETYWEIYQNISVDSGQITKIRLNFAGYAELIRHPYIDKLLAESILDYRNKNGSFHTMKEFEDSGILDDEKFRKLKPYITCR